MQIPADPNSSLGQVALLVQLLLSHLKLWFNVAQVGGEERSTSTGQRRVPRRNYIEHRSLPHTLPMQRTSTEYVPLTAQLLFAKLRQKGWCPYRIHTTTQSLTYPTLFYLCNIDQRSSTRISHECCSFDVCRTNEQQAQTNPLKDPCHRTADCACSCVGPDLSIVGEIIDQGGVPLIEVQSSSAGTLTLKVVKCAPYTRYTAISHVVSPTVHPPSLLATARKDLTYLTILTFSGQIDNLAQSTTPYRFVRSSTCINASRIFLLDLVVVSGLSIVSVQ